MGRNDDALMFSLFAAVFGEMGEGAAAAGLIVAPPARWALVWLMPVLLILTGALPTGVPFAPAPEA